MPPRAKYLTGNSEPSELIYFKIYKSQVPVIERALETAARPELHKHTGQDTAGALQPEFP
jgi:hypothetical protein